MQGHQKSPEVGLTEKQEDHIVVLILLSCWDTGTDYIECLEPWSAVSWFSLSSFLCKRRVWADGR